MKKFTLFSLALLFFIGMANSYAQIPDWSRVLQTTNTINQDGKLRFNYVKHDDAGNAYVQSSAAGYCNYFGNIIKGGTNLTVVAKHDISGKVLWVNQIADLKQSINGPRFTIDKDNAVLTVGAFGTSLNIDNNFFTNLNGTNDGYVAKYSESGKVEWAVQLSSDGKLEIYGVTTDLAGNVIVSGSFNSKATILGTVIDAGIVEGAFILKLSSSGNLIWVKGFPIGTTVYMAFASTDGNNNIYLAGDYSAATNGIFRFDTTSTPQTEIESSVLTKFNPDGNAQWVRAFGGVKGDPNSYSWPVDLKTDSLGNSYLWGWCLNNAAFGAFTLTNPIGTGYSYYLTKLSNTGNVLWAKAVYETKYSFNYGDLLDLDKKGNVYVGGHFKDTIRIENTNYLPNGLNDFFVSKFTDAGVFQWIRTIPSNALIINALSVIKEDLLTIAGGAGKDSTLGAFKIVRDTSAVNIIATLGEYNRADFSSVIDAVGLTVSFTDLSTPASTNWYWTMGDGKIFKTQNPVYTYPKAGVYKVCLTVFDNVSSLSQSVCKEIRVGEMACLLKSDFSYYVSEIDAPVKSSNAFGYNIALFNKTNGSPDAFFWTFGDGGSSTLENPNYQYSNPGYYKVSLSVRNSNTNCLDELTQLVQVGNLDCRADFVYRVNPDNNSVVFKDDSKGVINYYYWDLGDGTYSVEQSLFHNYKKAGIYLVGQTVINVLSGCMDYTMRPVQVGEISCSAGFKSYVDASNNNAYFTNSVLGDATVLLWTFGDGSYSTEPDPVHQFAAQGIYSVGLNTYNSANGCMDYSQDHLVIGSIANDCNADFVYRVEPASSEVSFNNKSMGNIVASLWNFGDDTENSLETSPKHTYSKAGYYYVCLGVTNDQGIKNMGCKWVLIQPDISNECKANFMYTVDSASLAVKFVDNSFGDINKYTWDFGDSKSDSVSNLKNPGHVYDQKGYYTVKLKVENTATGCVSKDYKLLNVAENQVLKASFGYEAYGDNKKVAGYPVDLVSASSGDGATVEWDFGDKDVKKETFTVMDSSTRIVTHYYAMSGKYRVCLRISDPVTGQSDVYCSFVSTKNAVAIEKSEGKTFKLNVYPNPFISSTLIDYYLPQNQFVEIAIFDQLGRKVETLVKDTKESGDYEILWHPKNPAAGLYYLKMVTSNGIVTKQIVISK